MKPIHAVFMLLLLFISPTSWGHSKLTEAVPANGSTLQAIPSVIVLNFNKPIENKLHQAELLQGKRWQKLSTQAGEKSLQISLDGLALSLARSLAPSEDKKLQIRWRVISRDGHTQSGQLQYLLKP